MNRMSFQVLSLAFAVTFSLASTMVWSSETPLGNDDQRQNCGGCGLGNTIRRQNEKLSSALRELMERHIGMDARKSSGSALGRERRICAFVKADEKGDSVLRAEGCHVITHAKDIAIVDIPLSSLPRLAADRHVSRIEAQRSNRLQLDSTAVLTDMKPVRDGNMLPRAFTGNGVVMGVMDVGFDLTHPTFRDAMGSHTRIRRFWDQLSTDTVGSTLYVGADYTTEQAILGYAHSRDGFTIYHGTHTLGIAAGNGAGTRYVGMAPEADICLVSNAVNNDAEYIREEDLYRYTTATDWLGFKYIFDYAESVGKPCVISFSEGSTQDFGGDNKLYYEALSQIVGSGRIIVASAGNTGGIQNYVRKTAGQESVGVFMHNLDDSKTRFLVKSRDSYVLRTVVYHVEDAVRTSSPRVSVADGKLTLTVATDDLCAMSDSTLADTVYMGDVAYVQTLSAYHSSFDGRDIVVDVTMSGPQAVGNSPEISYEVVGEGVEAEMFRVYGTMAHRRSVNPSISFSDETHGVLVPGSHKDVICVGSSNGRRSYVNMSGETQTYDTGGRDARSVFSSVGPTFDGLAKPDVMAPGANVLSSISSYYLEKNPKKYEEIVEHVYDSGREYTWGADTGTSMSAPAVGGIIALWLEANPQLTPDDVKAVMRRTSRRCADSDSYGAELSNYCGSGIIDAYAGLLDILGLTAVDAISKENPKVDIRVGNGMIHVDFGKTIGSQWSVDIYSVKGEKVGHRTYDGGRQCYDVDMSEMPKGVYAVQITTGERMTTGSLLVRI